ncbi:PB1 domain-containing protein [Artemisia annua]|uniref:PB1 domain-containing protein n=1 Tax=Artemisia annua TaxID=35608 RepID=A0A2U1P187_ARTAN|nr:PB1 domain-containing protein [Artemisia annua]
MVPTLKNHGGKILPRPADGSLKYVGGETRVISVHRDITFNDLMKKLSSRLTDGDVTLKYELTPLDLDSLISVKSDEDLPHLFEECDRHELMGTQRLQTFLFPSKPIIIKSHMRSTDRGYHELQYINTINGIIMQPAPTYKSNFKPPTLNTSQTSFSISSACSSPGTPPETTIPTVGPDVINPEISGFRNFNTMTRARSSPNLFNLGATSQTNLRNPTPILTNQQYYYHHQPQPQPQYIYYPYPQQHSQSSPRPLPLPYPHQSSGTTDHLMRVRSPGLLEYHRHPMEHSQHAQTRQSRGGHMLYQRGSAYDEYYGNNRLDRESPPGSPLAPSPHQNSDVSKWDSTGGC